MGAGIALAGGVFGGIQKLKGISDQKRVSKAQARFQQRVAKNNAIRAEAAAQDVLKTGQIQEQRQRSVTSQAISSSRANAAARGVEVDIGSAADVVSSIAQVGEEEALTIRQNAVNQAFAIRQNAENFEQEAEFARVARKNADLTASRQLFGTLINTGTSVASRWFAGAG